MIRHCSLTAAPMSTRQPDNIYAKPLDAIDRFAFDERVASVFKDMINRSVPGYQTVLGMLGVLAANHAVDGTHVYDLGCSLGGSTLMLRQHIQHDCKIIGVDYSPEMVERCKQNVADDPHPLPTEILCNDIRDIEFKPCSVVVMNFTLQFLPVEDRDVLLKKILKALVPGGAFILCEKVKFASDEEQTWQTEMYHSFKKANGYSELEVAQKRSALEDVLRPETIEQHKNRLLTCGFDDVHSWFQCLSFAGIIATRS